MLDNRETNSLLYSFECLGFICYHYIGTLFLLSTQTCNVRLFWLVLVGLAHVISQHICWRRRPASSWPTVVHWKFSSIFVSAQTFRVHSTNMYTYTKHTANTYLTTGDANTAPACRDRGLSARLPRLAAVSVCGRRVGEYHIFPRGEFARI